MADPNGETTTMTCNLMVTFSNIIFGSVLLWMRSVHSNDACGLPFLSWALILAIFEFVQTGIMFLRLFNCGVVYNVSGLVLEVLVNLARIGLLIWGTVIAFSNNLWMDHLNGNPEVLDACPNSAYIPFAVLIIAYWLCGIGQGAAKSKTV